MLPDKRNEHRRQPWIAEGEQGRRRRTCGRFSECELWLWALHFFPSVSPYTYAESTTHSSTFLHFSWAFPA